MIVFPNTKINIGLNITAKREDGYHNLETVFYPINLRDILEVIDSKNFDFINTGIKIDCLPNENLCVKAYKKIKNEFDIPPVKIVLYKNVPFGSGLGSGSSDAAHMLILLNEKFNLGITKQKLLELASGIGADCAFFMKNKPVFAQGIGNIFTDIELSLKNYYLMICFPGINISTQEAYANCIPKSSDIKLTELIKLPIAEWKEHIKNDFEASIFHKHKKISKIKSELYETGAIYAQMSGSGSAVYGIFNENPEKIKLKNCDNIKVVKLN